MKKDSLGDRMKGYEAISKTSLMKRTPAIIRIDGKAFHTFTRGFQKPFDEVLAKTMQETAQYLCEHIQGCVYGYTQSDEITLVLCDYQTLTTSGWFDYEVQKLCSISASMATMAFNRFFADNVISYHEMHCEELNDHGEQKQYEIYLKACDKGAMFDSRCFSLPKEEVVNCILWRQQDATRNSIQMVAQANFSHKELQNKSCNLLQEMLFLHKGINWDNYPTHLKRGTSIIKNSEGKWIIDEDMPILTQDRNYVEKLIHFD
ncbi:MAG: tRNA-His guanylyltransferase [Wendovervirus sonii]|uniref:tRNA-His guanylyltransferase n=1 Tax=phage Lak_Megaphage_Sonny TaxID=3109229 RepID=A0ABZ0Z3M5_9CAUD|nr:MAG: tRNA-His guanylyltransferase [phage Lak_Megaphage_Sonny]